MAHDPEHFPHLTDFPAEDGLLPDVTLPMMSHASGLMVAQDGDDYTQIMVSLFAGPSPQQGGLVVTVDGAGARELAEHLVRLATYAEMNLPAHEPGCPNG